ncbi:hypothetical protein Aduo_018511 [Ancylostoma duodenale]
MISVTVAAHGRSRRCVGAHLRAYGSGRLSICDLERENTQKKKNIRPQAHWKMFWEKLCHIIVVTLQLCFPGLFRLFYTSHNSKLDLNGYSTDLKSTCIPYSPIHEFPNDVLARIFHFLDCRTLLNCELTCKRWSTVIEEHLEALPKLPTDQIRILFDEAEVLIYPIDEKRCPVRYAMPSLQGLERRLRHLTTQSLFIRGLIPVESAPVLRSLLSLSLRPQQIYFIWSKFSPSSVPMLEKLLCANRDTVVDIGLEECSPPHLFTDQLLDALLPGLTCVRLWNNGKSGNYGISDRSINKLARYE